MKTHAFRLLFFLLLLTLLLPLAGRAEDDRSIELTVAKNDNLINLCKKYLAEPSRWQEVGRINRLKDFDLIHMGKILIIPVRLLRGVPLDGRVLFARGDVTLRAAEGAPWTTLRPNDPVRQGQLVRTGPESVVEIAFADGTSFIQRPETVLDLNVTQQKGDSHIFQKLILQTGRMLMKVRRATGKESRVEIQTPSATAVARGTDFRVAVDAGESMTSEVLQGTVDVAAMRQSVVLRQGEGTRVNKGEPPLPPRKLLPPPALADAQPFYRTMPLSLAFAPMEGAVSYRLQLSKDQEGRDVIREKVISAGKPLELDRLEDGAYYLQGWGIDGLGLDGIPMATQLIRVRVHPLPPFTQEPADNARINGKSVSFNWMKVRDAARYELQIARDRAFRDPVGGVPAEVEGTSYDRVFDDFGSYHFRIRSRAVDGYKGIWSDPIAFALVPPPPSPPLEKPALDDREIRIRWRGQGDGMSYRCQVAREEAFVNPILEKKVDRPEVSLPRPEAPGVYYVRTSTIDPTGYEGAFSFPQSFEIKPPPPPPAKPVEEKRDWTGAYILGIMGMGMFLLLLF